MRIPTRYKVFFVLLFTIGLVVAGMTLFMTQSLEEGFVRFIDARQQGRIDGIAQRLTQEYIDGGNWQRLDSDELRWQLMLIGNIDEIPQHRPSVAGSQATEDVSGMKSDNPLFTQVPGLGSSYLPVERRVMLLDADKSIIYGIPALANRLKLQPLTVDGRTVGYLGVLPGPTLLHLSGAHFLDKQSDAFILIALLVMVLSALLAFPVVGHLMQPLRAFTQGARALAAGRYDARIPVESSDEIGQMAKDFNSLAQALEDNETMRRQWMADISHELRTPLSILRGEIEALQDGMRPLDQKAVNALHGEVLHLGRLVDDLYELSMSDLGSLTYRKTMLDPITILRDCLEAHEAEFRGKGITISVEQQTAERPEISADRDGSRNCSIIC
jgi:two-component system sensor histidine kinase BaeS